MSICATAGLHSNQVSSKNTIVENSTWVGVLCTCDDDEEEIEKLCPETQCTSASVKPTTKNSVQLRESPFKASFCLGLPWLSIYTEFILLTSTFQFVIKGNLIVRYTTEYETTYKTGTAQFYSIVLISIYSNSLIHIFHNLSDFIRVPDQVWYQMRGHIQVGLCPSILSCLSMFTLPGPNTSKNAAPPIPSNVPPPTRHHMKTSAQHHTSNHHNLCLHQQYHQLSFLT